MLPDIELARRAKAGDSASFKALATRYESWIFTVVRRITENDLEAEDVTQQAFLSAIENLDCFHEDDSFSTWLQRVATQAAFKIVRKREGRPALEETLRTERGFNAAVLETVAALVFALDPAGRVVQFNRACRELTGYSSEEVCGRPIWETLLLPEEIVAVKAVFEQLRAGQFPNQHENFFLTKNGRRRLIAWSNTALANSDGSVKCVIGTGVDITERRLAERCERLQYDTTGTLAESATMTEAAPRILQIICETMDWKLGELWFGSRNMQTLTYVESWQQQERAITSSESVTQPCGTTFAPGVGLLGRVWASGKPESVASVMQDTNFPSGTCAIKLGLLEAFAFPILLRNEVLGVMVFFSRQIRELESELTQTFLAIGNQIGQFMERNRAEENVRCNEAALARAQEIAHVGSYSISLDGSGGDPWSAETFRILGLDPTHGTLSREDYIRKIVHPDDRARVLEALRKSVAHAVPHNIEYRIVRPDGSLRHIHDLAEPVLGSENKVVEFIGTFHDVTERKELEAASTSAAEQERGRIARELHDGLGQQLGGAIFLTNLLLRDLEERGAAEAGRARQVQTVIEKAVADAREIAHGLYPVPPELDGLMTALENLTERVTRYCRIECRFDLDSAVLLDDIVAASHLYRLAQEAVNNAVKHSGAQRIDVRLAARDNQVELTVRDNGKGLSATGCPLRGQGMQTMRHRAQMLGGRLTVENAAGGGTLVRCIAPHSCAKWTTVPSIETTS